MTCFERFITKENYNVMKRYVTGCKHFQDPVLETEYNSFASQSDYMVWWSLGRVIPTIATNWYYILHFEVCIIRRNWKLVKSGITRPPPQANTFQSVRPEIDPKLRHYVLLGGNYSNLIKPISQTLLKTWTPPTRIYPRTGLVIWLRKTKPIFFAMH